jgi:prepilin-type N-terminal cleavage/methylation domain-containing protein
LKGKFSRIPAFTLTELLVAMAIAAIVIGLASSILNLFFKNIQSIQSNYAANTEINLLEQQLVVDFNTYHSITYNNDTELLQLKNELDSVSYKFQDGSILRKGDTILSKNYTKQVLYLGNTITTGNIDAIKLEFIESNTFIFCYKENDAFDIVATNGD